MFIIPLTGKLSWRNPPIVTIAVILINCLVWFFFQGGDTKQQYRVSELYFTSGLAEIEISRYIAYREGRLEEISAGGEVDEQPDQETLVRYYLEMQRDDRFLKKLENDEIVTPSDPLYAEWKELRSAYISERSKLTSFKYGFIPAKKSLLTSLTYMFMHGSTGHLAGNMIFLWIVGCMLEMGLGRLRYSILYIIGGLFAVWVYWLVYMNSTTPLVGASGAIAGLMGAFAVLFGKKRVKIFYSLGVYFNYITIPAIILLPLWMGNEFFQLFVGGAAHVAYAAHIGGLIGGAFLGFICLKFSLGFDHDVIKEERADETAPLIEKALKHIAELDMESGRQLLEKVLAKEPENIDALTHLFNVYKLDPDDAKFHNVTKKLIFELTRSYNTYEKAHAIYQEYIRHTSQARLTPQLYIQLSITFAAAGHLENAVRIITMLLKKVPDSPGVSTALLKLARAYDQKGLMAQGQKCMQLICSKYPESIEAQVARKALQN
jgi:membrane associated rhomboid family serine protease